jgi:SAM-dependent methyltransferase
MTGARERFKELNEAKANFGRLYAAPDPREYYRVLYGLDYIVPDLARSIFRALIAARETDLRRRVRVLDLGCSYGVNAALARFPFDLARLAQRYAGPEMQGLATSTLIDLDRHYFRSWPRLTDAQFIGLDASRPAIDYATAVGLLDYGVATDLEHHEPTAAESEILSGVDLIVSTGCVGYVTRRTFRHLLDRAHPGDPPWVASFVLRMFSYHEIADLLARHGLVTEKLEGITFIQRRFHSEDELRSVVANLEGQGIDPSGKEADGLYHAELYVSRPEAVVRDMPLTSVLSITSGASRPFGRRFRFVDGGSVKLVP